MPSTLCDGARADALGAARLVGEEVHGGVALLCWMQRERGARVPVRVDLARWVMSAAWGGAARVVTAVRGGLGPCGCACSVMCGAVALAGEDACGGRGRSVGRGQKVFVAQICALCADVLVHACLGGALEELGAGCCSHGGRGAGRFGLAEGGPCCVPSLRRGEV